MGYYHIPLDQASIDISIIILTRSHYTCLRLPMGIYVVVDIFQAYVASLFLEVEMVLLYIDNLLIFLSSMRENHLQKLQIVFMHL